MICLEDSEHSRARGGDLCSSAIKPCTFSGRGRGRVLWWQRGVFILQVQPATLSGLCHPHAHQPKAQAALAIPRRRRRRTGERTRAEACTSDCGLQSISVSLWFLFSQACLTISWIILRFMGDIPEPKSTDSTSQASSTISHPLPHRQGRRLSTLVGLDQVNSYCLLLYSEKQTTDSHNFYHCVNVNRKYWERTRRSLEVETEEPRLLLRRSLQFSSFSPYSCVISECVLWWCVLFSPFISQNTWRKTGTFWLERVQLSIGLWHPWKNCTLSLDMLCWDETYGKHSVVFIVMRKNYQYDISLFIYVLLFLFFCLNRDEIYCQICKQLVNNNNGKSRTQGWILLSICLGIFPPTDLFVKVRKSFLVTPQCVSFPCLVQRLL